MTQTETIVPEEGKKQNTSDERNDDAFDFAAETFGIQVSPEDDKRILRKIDLVLMPILMITYSLKFLDQQAMSYSANFGLLKDMHLNESQYAWASGSIINLAILVSQPFVSRSLQLFPLGLYISVNVFIWGILLLCTAAARSFAAIAVLRVFLGIFEAGITPAVVLMVSMWYKRDREQPSRQAAWFFGNAAAQMVGGLIGYGIGHIKSNLDVGAWIWYFIIVGSITICWGGFCCFIIPDNPTRAKFLTHDEKVLAIARLKDNHTGIINHNWKWTHFTECLTDLNIWAYAALLFLSAIPSGGIASFGNIVIKDFGFSSLDTTLLTIPLGAIQALSLLVSSLLNSRFRNIRCLVAAVSQVPPLIGAVLLMKLGQENHGGRLASYYIFQTHTVNDVMVYALFTANTSGFCKKTVGAAIMFIASAVGLIVGPQLFKASEAPVYSTAFNAAISCFALQIMIPFLIFLHLRWSNSKKAQALVGLPARTADEQYQEGLMDLTDKEQPHFTYVY